MIWKILFEVFCGMLAFSIYKFFLRNDMFKTGKVLSIIGVALSLSSAHFFFGSLKKDLIFFIFSASFTVLFIVEYLLIWVTNKIVEDEKLLE